jgi:hypothetical protein
MPIKPMINFDFKDYYRNTYRKNIVAILGVFQIVLQHFPNIPVDKKD